MRLPQGMVSALAELCERRYHTAIGEGMAEREVFAEMVETILEMYFEAAGVTPNFRTHDGPRTPQ